LSGRPLHGTEADSALFVDRERDLEAVEQAVKRSTNVLVLGDRGTGKTTLLRRAAQDLARDGMRAVFVEGGLATSAPEFLSLLQYRVAPESAPIRAKGAAEELLERVEALGRSLEAADRPVVVLVDELPAAEVGHTLFGRLRDSLWQLPLQWVVAGDVADRAVYLRPPADAFFPRVVVLGPLDLEASIELLRARISPKEASDRRLREIAANAEGNPRALVSLASRTLLGGEDLHEVATHRVRQREALEELGQPARRVAAALEAAGRASASDDQFLARLGWSRSRATQVLRELEEAGIVTGSLERREGGRPRKVYELRDR
jgi:hypothetical protein